MARKETPDHLCKMCTLCLERWTYLLCCKLGTFGTSQFTRRARDSSLHLNLIAQLGPVLLAQALHLVCGPCLMMLARSTCLSLLLPICLLSTLLAQLTAGFETSGHQQQPVKRIEKGQHVMELDGFTFYPSISDGGLWFVEFYVHDCRCGAAAHECAMQVSPVAEPHRCMGHSSHVHAAC